MTFLISLSFVVDGNIYDGATRLYSRTIVLCYFRGLNAISSGRASVILQVVHFDKAVVMTLQYFIFEFFNEFLSLRFPLRFGPLTADHRPRLVIQETLL